METIVNYIKSGTGGSSL